MISIFSLLTANPIVISLSVSEYACFTALVTASLTAILVSSISSYDAPTLFNTPDNVKRTSPTYSGFEGKEHTSELQSRFDLVCRLLLEKKKHITLVDSHMSFSTYYKV